HPGADPRPGLPGRPGGRRRTGPDPGGRRRPERKEQLMGAHEDTVRVLETELGQVERAFRGLSAEQWRTPTKLLPLDDSQTPWTLFELAGHFDISLGLTVMRVV